MATCLDRTLLKLNLGPREVMGNGCRSSNTVVEGRDGDSIVLRDYQQGLSQMGVRQNIIVCLPTGSGKTMIAVAVMNSLEFRHEVLNENKKIVFVVTTVQLAQQQAAYIRKYTEYKVLVCTSDNTKANTWTSKRWKDEIEAHHVLVMIAQICFDKILSNIFNFDRLAILVLDECHNATKLHKMNEIMVLYHKYVEANVSSHKPRIIGLTATINKRKIRQEVTEGCLLAEIAKLESKLASKAVSYEDMDEVKRFSTESIIKSEVFSTSPKPTWFGFIDGITKIQHFIEHQKDPKRNLSLITRQAMTSNLPNFNLSKTFVNDTDNIKKELNRMLLDFQELYDSIGPLACYNMVPYKLELVKDLSRKITCGHSKLDSLNIKAVCTQLHRFDAHVSQHLDPRKRKGKILADVCRSLVTYKVEVLLKLLADYGTNEGTDDQLLGLVFVKRRSFAAAIKMLLEDMARAAPEQYGFIKSELITGTNRKKKDCQSLRVSQSDQRDIIDSFRKRKINLIICTTVLEEGIDVPSCNLVVRFDEIHAYTSFIQSMGRARKRGATFCILIPATSADKAQRNIDKFLDQHVTMTKVLNDHKDKSFTHIITGVRDDDEEPPLDIEDFAPYGPSGPMITASSAIALVYQYVQKCPEREILPWWSFDEPEPKKPYHKFRGYVWIKGSPCFPGVVQGPLMCSSDGAKKAVFMEVCRLLFAADALDKQHLLPM